MNKKILNHIRSFGMSGFLVNEELKKIEYKYNVELGHKRETEIGKESIHYNQFESTVRKEASKMSQHYELFYCLEMSIQKLITETLSENEGGAWWNSGRVPPEIVGDAKKEKNEKLTAV